MHNFGRKIYLDQKCSNGSYHVFYRMKPNCSAHSRHPDIWKAKFERDIKTFSLFLFFPLLWLLFWAFPHCHVSLLVSHSLCALSLRATSCLPGRLGKRSFWTVFMFYVFCLTFKLSNVNLCSHLFKKGLESCKTSCQKTKSERWTIRNWTNILSFSFLIFRHSLCVFEDVLEPPTRGVGHLLSGSKFNKLLSSTLHWGATTMTAIKSKNTAKILHKIFRGSNGSNICPFICKNVKDWSHKFEIWHADQSAHALRKHRKNCESCPVSLLIVR